MELLHNHMFQRLVSPIFLSLLYSANSFHVADRCCFLPLLLHFYVMHRAIELAIVFIFCRTQFSLLPAYKCIAFQISISYHEQAARSMNAMIDTDRKDPESTRK